MGAKSGVETLPVPQKSNGGLEKKTWKSMKQDENEQNTEKQPTPVVGKKSNGKSQFSIRQRGHLGLGSRAAGLISPRREVGA
jgi:hypothetical protein